ncbi:hypothetical protein [Hymenobacter metallicola]|uniref:hypothetical protein n=1 Tax=Hymenobacter metallicola TaxID=2563114 RepID=UPI001436A500|nr:hypothetical protein [Hymenobacter metallicola]
MSTDRPRASVLACHRKPQYKTKKDAEHANRFIQQYEALAYRCKHCRKFHTIIIQY